MGIIRNGLLSLLPIAYAAPWGACLEETDVATFQCFAPLLGNLIRGLVALSAVALFVILLSGGFTYLFSGGDQKKLEQAKGTISGAIMGLVFIICAYLILRLIAQFTGVTGVLRFEIPR